MSVGSKNSRQFRGLFGESIPFKATVDMGSAAVGEFAAADITVAGAAVGDFVMIAPGIDLTDVILSAQVSAANTVTVVVNNNTAGIVDLDSQVFTGAVLKAGHVFESL